MVLKASAGSMRGATAATLPPAMATSRTALDAVLGVDDVPAAQEEVVLRLRGRSLRAGAGRGEQTARDDGGQVHANHAFNPFARRAAVPSSAPPRYSPMSRVPPISSPVTLPVNV